mgnify:CR=1 FL=1
MSTKKKEIKNDKTKTRFILQAQNPLAEELYARIKEQGFSVSTVFFEDVCFFEVSFRDTRLK